MDTPLVELVNHPQHYQSCAIETRHIVEFLGIPVADLDRECIDVIEDRLLDFHVGNAVKYLWRYGQKSKAQSLTDLEKARWYVVRVQKKFDELSLSFRLNAEAITAIDDLIKVHTGA